MKKLLIMIYLSLLISSCNGEKRKEVSNKAINKAEDNKVKSSNNVLNDKNINWVKLEKIYVGVFLEKENDEIIEEVKEGTAYIEENGKKLICGKIKNGKKEGHWIDYYEDSKEEGEYKNGFKEGKWVILDKNGKKIEEGNYKNGFKEGKWLENNGEDIKGEKCEGVYKDGLKEGKWVFLDKNGKKIQEVNYKNGEKIGDWEEERKNTKIGDCTEEKEIDRKISCGKIKNGKKEGEWIEGDAKGNYKDGKKEGHWIYFYENGKKQYEGDYHNGEKEGKWIYFYDNGAKFYEVTFKNGKREGKWKFWSSLGIKEPEAELNYKDGKLDGICRVGSVSIYIINYKNGKKDGRYNYFGEDGSEEVGLYEDGEKIGEWLDDNGKTIYINGEKVKYDML